MTSVTIGAGGQREFFVDLAKLSRSNAAINALLAMWRHSDNMSFDEWAQTAILFLTRENDNLRRAVIENLKRQAPESSGVADLKYSLVTADGRPAGEAMIPYEILRSAALVWHWMNENRVVKLNGLSRAAVALVRD